MARLSLWLCLGAAARAGGQGVDDLELRLLEAAELPLRWDNVEHAPVFVSGPRPRRVRRAGAHLVKLEPGSAVTIRLEPDVMLRVHNPFGSLEAGAVQLSLSDGSGLWAEAVARPVAAGDSLLLQPGGGQAQLARVARPAAHATGVELAIYTSRREPLGPLARYGRVVALGGTRLEVKRDGSSAGAPYWRLEPGQPVRVALEGPARLAIETRLLYPASESQSFQGYRVHARLDGAAFAALEYETGLDSAPVAVDGRPRAVGRLETAYLDLPSGRHALELEPSVALAARVSARDDSEYLLPDLNREPALPKRLGGPPSPAVPSAWELSEDEARRIASGGVRGASRTHGLALRLARDNARPDGGLVAASLVAGLAAKRPDAPWLRDAAEALRAAHTWHRDLLPIAKQASEPQAVGWFVTRRLRPLGERPGALAISELLLDNPPEGLSQGIFLEVPEGRSNAQRYPLPHQHAPSWLRVVAQSTAEAEFVLQIDEEPPARFHLGPGPERPLAEYRPSRADAALAALARRGHALPGGPPIAAGTAELPLPVAAKELRLWREGSGAARVALQYRASRPYRLSESEYRDLVRRAGGETAVATAFLALARGQAAVDAAGSDAMRELANHWEPLLSLLATRDRTFAAAVVPSSAAATAGRFPEAAVVALATEAGALAAKGQWLPALEAWSSVYFAGATPLRRQAALERVAALEALGETDLAELQLRGLFLHDHDPQLRDAAFERLAALSTRGADTEGLGLLLAAAARRAPTPERLAALCDALLAEGEPELALMLRLAVGQGTSAPTTGIRAALGARWWGAFEDALAGLTTTERSYWTGERLLAQGDALGAVAQFRHGGEPGLAAAAYVEDALAIRRRLESGDAAQRVEALFAWEGWLARDPRPRAWRAADALVVDHAGGRFTSAGDRGSPVRYYAATPERPVRFEALGPMRLRIEARPLHSAGSSRAADDWLRVVADDLLELVPITANRPSPDVRLIGDATQQPGRRVEASLELGPGRHAIAASAARLPLIVRVFVEGAENSVGVLRDLLPSALTAVVNGSRDTAEASEPWGEALVFPLDEGEAVAVALQPPSRASTRGSPVVPMSGLSPLSAARLALRLGTPLAFDTKLALGESFVAGEAISPEERLLALSRLGDPRASCLSLMAQDLGVPERLRQAKCVAEGRLDEALASATGEADADVVRRLSLLLRLADERPEEVARAQALGEALFSDHARLELAGAIRARLMRGSGWLPAPSPASSAGVRPIELGAGPPEDPMARVHRSLLPPALAGEQILAGGGTLALSFSNQAAAEVELGLAREDLEYLPPTPLTAWRQLDEAPAQRVRLTPEAPRQVLRLSVPAGHHVLRIGINEALVNQFLRVSARERRSRAWVPILDGIARTYHVATSEEPFRIELAGPAWVRVDERRGERTFSRYEAVPAGGRSLEILPQDGSEALLRLFQRAPDAATGPTLLLRPQRNALEPGPGALLELNDPRPAGRLRLEDALPLGRQEDASWSFSSALEHRILFGEDAAGRQPAQEFAELRLGRRFSSLGRRRYDRSDVLARINAQGGPTLGLLQQFHHRAGSRILRADASGYMQTSGGSGTPGGGVHWSLTLAGELSQRWWFGPSTYHTPSLGLFGRALSLAADAPVDPAAVDRDVFTRYKARHRAGLVLSDTLTHAPWLDAEAWGTASLTSNETVQDGLDQLSLEGGWRQKLGPVLVAGEYRATRFFADRDRLRATTRQALSLQLGAEAWRGNRQRVELELRYRYYVTERRSSAGLFLSWYPDHGRGFRDFAPRSVEFRELRERRAARTVNNRLWEEP